MSRKRRRPVRVASFSRSLHFLSCLYLDCSCYDLGDILDAQLFLGLDAFDAVVEHGDAEGAGGGQHFRAGLQGLVDAGLVDALADLLFHPGAPAAAAAAEALVAVAAHLR